MNARTKFLKIYNSLPERAKARLIYNPYSNTPMTLNVLALEVDHETILSEAVIKDLGVENDEA